MSDEEKNQESAHENEGVTLEEIQKEQEELDYKNKYLQALADNENTLKRMQKERQKMVKFAAEGVLEDFLAPLDNFESALGHSENMSDEVKNWAFGFRMILTELKDVLKNNGIDSYDSLGEAFDPNLHEAMEVEDRDDVEEGTILKEFIRGYKSGERILRPSKVKVAKRINLEKEKES
ncbi:MAG: nucleotide exchange factor GrpE [Simkaniaceae bacterium]